MGCANEKECKHTINEHSCGVFNLKCADQRPTQKINHITQEKQQHISEAKDHYLSGSIRTEFNECSSFLFDRRTQTQSSKKKSSFTKLESIDQDFLIGQYLNMGDEIDETQMRTKSFNPGDKWKKMSEEYKEEYKEKYVTMQDKLKNEFQDDFLRKSYNKSKSNYNKKLRLGPSQEIRWLSWKTKLLDNKEHKELFQLKVNNLYEFLLFPFKIQEKEQFYDDNMHLITKDIARTFPEMKFFDTIGKYQLQRTLLATSNLLRNVGYCQGMNFIMGVLLLVSGAQESPSFECFISLAFRKEYMLVGLFETGFPLLRFLEFVFDELFRNELPELYKHFKEQDIQNTVWITKWLMTLYLYSFPISMSIRIMDFMISSNVFALIYVALQILSLLQHQLLKMDSIEVVTYFSRKNGSPDENEDNHDDPNLITFDQINIDQIIQNASKFQLTDKQIRRLAGECSDSIIEEYSQLIDSASEGYSEDDFFLRNYSAELNRIIQFLRYYTLQGLGEEQLKYHSQLKTKYINQEVVQRTQ